MAGSPFGGKASVSHFQENPFRALSLPPRPAPTASAQHLCSRCAALDMDDLLRRHNASAFDEATTIWIWNETDIPDWLKPDCGFCRLVKVIKDLYGVPSPPSGNFPRQEYLYALRGSGAPPIPLGLKRYENIGNGYGHARLSKFSRTSKSRTPKRRTPKRRMPKSRMPKSRTWVFFIASRSSVHSQGSLLVRTIKADQIDFSVMRGWWAPQNKIRNMPYRSHDAANFPARVIDCRTGRIVAANNRVYVALSYVWGKPVPGYYDDDTSSEDELPEVLPATVKDAIIATQQLGYHYLWVDKYCINQSDEQDKIHQVQNMDIIYKGAEVTIVAAAGHDTHFGLPGVGSRPRKALQQVRMGGIDIVVVSETAVVQEIIQKSAWNSRGWTYQEARLSCRLLIFTEHEVYFESREGNYRETVELPHPCMEDNLFIPHSARSDPWQANNPEIVTRVIAEYSTKKLTHNEDALMAALGFLKAFQLGPKPVYHHWGVPIFPDQAIGSDYSRKFPCLGPMVDRPFSSDGFLLGLCWQPGGDRLFGNLGMRLTRRQDLPSWSWAGWSCVLEERPQTIEEMQRFSTLVYAHQEATKVLLELCDQITVPLEQLWEIQQRGHELAVFSRFIYLDAYAVPLRMVREPLEKECRYGTRIDNNVPVPLGIEPNIEYQPAAHAGFQYPEPFSLRFGEVKFRLWYGGWGNRKDCFISLVPGEELMRRHTDAPTSQPLLGLLLGFFGDALQDRVLLLLVVFDCGGYYERVGFIRQQDTMPKLNFSDLLERKIKKTRVRIG
jgi:hypothetical protein